MCVLCDGIVVKNDEIDYWVLCVVLLIIGSEELLKHEIEWWYGM